MFNLLLTASSRVQSFVRLTNYHTTVPTSQGRINSFRGLIQLKDFGGAPINI